MKLLYGLLVGMLIFVIIFSRPLGNWLSGESAPQSFRIYLKRSMVTAQLDQDIEGMADDVALKKKYTVHKNKDGVSRIYRIPACAGEFCDIFVQFMGYGRIVTIFKDKDPALIADISAETGAKKEMVTFSEILIPQIQNHYGMDVVHVRMVTEHESDMRYLCATLRLFCSRVGEWY